MKWDKRQLEEGIRKALADKSVIWDKGESTVCDQDKGHYSIPCENAFEGEIFEGDLAGCRLIVDRIKTKGKCGFVASVMTKDGQIPLSPAVGETMWNEAAKRYY
jgi:hypothetical protein